MKSEYSITKRFLWRHVNKKMNYLIHHYHIFSVLSILFDEILKDLQEGKSLNIINFGTLRLNDLAPRRYYDVREQTIKISQPHKILKFTLSKSFKKMILNYLND